MALIRNCRGFPSSLTENDIFALTTFASNRLSNLNVQFPRYGSDVCALVALGSLCSLRQHAAWTALACLGSPALRSPDGVKYGPYVSRAENSRQPLYGSSCFFAKQRLTLYSVTVSCKPHRTSVWGMTVW